MHLSIVIPFYNEESNVADLYDAVRPEIEKLDVTHEIIMVDDEVRKIPCAKLKNAIAKMKTFAQ